MITRCRPLAILVVVLFGMMTAARPAQAQKLPDETQQEVLIKTTLLTFNDANVTGNYTVLHAKLSKPFRDQYSPERLKETFKVFSEKHVDLEIIAAKSPISTEARVNDDGALLLSGYFDTRPSRVYYDLAFIMSDGEWKATKINVNIRRPPDAN
jgi:hypothetical protein